DPIQVQANLAAVSKALWELIARRARLELERDGAEAIDFPDDLIKAATDPEIGRIVTGERRLFELRRQAQRGQIAQLQERIPQLRDEIAGIAEQTEAKRRESELIERELAGVRELWQKNLIQITRLTALERDAARLSGEHGQLVASSAQAKGK